jgi:hypothetical protein
VNLSRFFSTANTILYQERHRGRTALYAEMRAPAMPVENPNLIEVVMDGDC